MKKIVICCLTLALLAPLAASANPLGGSITGVHRAPASGMGIHRILYRGGERADFSFAGDGDTTLNVIVRDENGFEVSVYNQYVWRAY